MKELSIQQSKAVSGAEPYGFSFLVDLVLNPVRVKPSSNMNVVETIDSIPGQGYYVTTTTYTF